ncbi:hypothetical protein H0H81_007668 [Sphagnurus paluster]|uniref:BTB domain-containing protein n=1 Tax=Sphagnurus paluster TaxID=117069 RepID=A0A9P7GQN9_9AGAR|nr:hypothetical protein H0H81_007668 [Sphagnurus paluster]
MELELESPSSQTNTIQAEVDSTTIENGKRQRCIAEPLDHRSPTTKKSRSSSMDSRDTQALGNITMKRDPAYYFEDGSCIFLVEDTLFNVCVNFHQTWLVHRTRLSNDSSSFGVMFTLPQGSLDAEGQSDDNPIILTGETASEFRNFLWSFYALPPDICAAGDNLPKLIDIARISNKYAFKNLESWALNTIHDYVNRKPSPILATIPAPQSYTFSLVDRSAPSESSTSIQSIEQLTKLIRLAQMCNHAPLLSTMIAHLRQLMSSSLQYAYLAMTLADELNIRTLRGVAYLEVMQKAAIVQPTGTDLVLKSMAELSPVVDSNDSETPVNIPSVNDDDKGPLRINPAQQLRLLAGYYRLTSTWERLRVTPPFFDHASSCGATWHQHGCTQSWLEFWKEKTRTDAMLGMGLADVVGRLKQVHKEYERWGSAPYMHHDCRNAARKAIQDVIKKVEEGLPDFFSVGGDVPSEQ